ncbi:hypothetical protein BDQ12DRAFT_698731 [Crucibulum laeve]|uniref:F-box domain-containing protein n=1 Tax=Crucibulum laeve TaxID=68775 RepID=A0A5C3LXX8_9AGAR|nr:hypothetical protein BDQ12DRAFT_698731 [Crucibulum laeve]
MGRRRFRGCPQRYGVVSCHSQSDSQVDPQVFQDRRALQLICSTWRVIVAEITAEYLTIYSDAELLATVKVLEASAKRKKKKGGKALGEWTTRIDFKILGPYNPAHIVRLLQCTPNLLIYINKNGSYASPERQTPTEVMEALVRHCRGLRRAEWSGPGEPPTFIDLATLVNGCPHLQTLRLICIYSYTMSCRPPVLTLPKLKTLSLGLIPESSEITSPDMPIVWDPLLDLLSQQSTQLPELERFEIDIFPLPLHPFFIMHGEKIRHFRVTTWSAVALLPDALERCPNLHSLVLSHGSDTLDLPEFLPNVKRICILPSVEDLVRVPTRVFAFAVLTPLDALLVALEKISAPGLDELRIRNSGAFVDLANHSLWLQGWWRRWNIRGVEFYDKSGKSFQVVEDEEERILDKVRE